jgi:hypothetical protein
VQQLWQVIANEDRSRAALDDPNAKIAFVNEKVEMQLLDTFLNAEDYKAPHKVSLAAYNPSVEVDPTLPPRPPKSLQWFREQRRWVKLVMASIQTRFAKKTGGGEMGTDGADADTVFYTYCRGDLLIMFMWLHFERGTAVQAHCTALLESDARMDIGGLNKACLTHYLPDTTVAGTSSPRKSSSSSGSRTQHRDQQLDAAFSTLSAIAEYLSPAKTQRAGAGDTEDLKAKRVAALASRVQSLEIAKNSVTGQLKADVQASIDKIVSEMLQV